MRQRLARYGDLDNLGTRGPPTPRPLTEYGLPLEQINFFHPLDKDELARQLTSRPKPKQRIPEKQHQFRQVSCQPRNVSEIRQWEERVKREQKEKMEGACKQRDLEEHAYVKKYQDRFQKKVDELNEAYDPDAEEFDTGSIVESNYGRDYDCSSTITTDYEDY